MKRRNTYTGDSSDRRVRSQSWLSPYGNALLTPEFTCEAAGLELCRRRGEPARLRQVQRFVRQPRERLYTELNLDDLCEFGIQFLPVRLCHLDQGELRVIQCLKSR